MQIYSVNVAVFLGGNKPSRTGDVRGDISVNFSCDPDISSKLVCHIKSLHILEYIYPIVFYAAWVYWLRISSGWFCFGGDIIPTGGRSFWRRCIDHPRNWTKSSWKWITGLVESVMLQLVLMHIGSHYYYFRSALCIFYKLQENYFWLDRILRSYQSRLFSGDIGSTFAVILIFFFLVQCSSMCTSFSSWLFSLRQQTLISRYACSFLAALHTCLAVCLFVLRWTSHLKCCSFVFLCAVPRGGAHKG